MLQFGSLEGLRRARLAFSALAESRSLGFTAFVWLGLIRQDAIPHPTAIFRSTRKPPETVREPLEAAPPQLQKCDATNHEPMSTGTPHTFTAIGSYSKTKHQSYVCSQRWAARLSNPFMAETLRKKWRKGGKSTLNNCSRIV